MVPGKASMIRTKEAGKTPLLPPHSPLRQEDIVGLFQNLGRINFPFHQQHYGLRQSESFGCGDIFARQPPV